MAKVVLPESRLRARRKRRRVRLGIAAVAAALLLLALLVGLSYLPFLQIKEVRVSGKQTFASSTIQTYVESQLQGRYWLLFPKKNILLYPKRAISAGLLSRFPELKVADVHAVNFHAIAAAVIERQPRALWCMQGEIPTTTSACYFMDEEGVVYAPAAAAAGDALVSYQGAAPGPLPKPYLDPEKFRSLSALIDALAQKYPGNPIKLVAVDGSGDVRAYFKQNFMLMFTLADAGGDVFERFNLALTADPFKAHALYNFEYLDLRFGDKLYYKLR